MNKQTRTTHGPRVHQTNSTCPAASAYRERAAAKGARGVQLVNWQRALEQRWANLRFGEGKVETKDEQHVFEVQLYLNDLDPRAVHVELYADGVNGGHPVRQERCRPATCCGNSDWPLAATPFQPAFRKLQSPRDQCSAAAATHASDPPH